MHIKRHLLSQLQRIEDSGKGLKAEEPVKLNALAEILSAAVETVLKGHGFSRAKNAIKHLAFRR